jgi:hypothetical protein
MDFLKKHYEKVLLGLVLAGLTVGAALLPWMISSERASLRALADEIIKRPVKPLADLDLSRVTNLLARASTPVQLDFSTDNKLFNPVAWQRRPDGALVKAPAGKDVGVNAVEVVKISPLYTSVTLESVTPPTETIPARYVVRVEREAAASAAQRRPRSYYATLNVKNEAFVIRAVKGPPEAPELSIQLNDSDELITVSKAKPFRRVDGYMADLKSENRLWSNQRVGSRIRIGNEDYNVVAIAANEVVLSAPSGKKTSRPYNPGS